MKQFPKMKRMIAIMFLIVKVRDRFRHNQQFLVSQMLHNLGVAVAIASGINCCIGNISMSEDDTMILDSESNLNRLIRKGPSVGS